MLAAALALAAPFTGLPAQPPVLIDSYRVQVATLREQPETITFRAPERLRLRTVGRFPSLEVSREGTTWIAPGGDRVNGSILRRGFAAEPDGFGQSGAARDADLAAFVLAQSRAGILTPTATTLTGRRALRWDVDLPPNDCAGLVARTARIWLAERTLLPLRVVERRRSDRRIERATSYVYSRLNQRPPTGTFRPPRTGSDPFVTDHGFRRTTPAAAAGPLPYIPRLPRVLPPGFRLAVSGWAPRSGITGPEGSIPASPWLFAAVYTRGVERIAVTQRAARTDWPDSPFGAECQPLATEAVTVNTSPARFGIGPQTLPHVVWRAGNLRYTVSGPFPRDDLVAIAASLSPIAP